MGSIYETVARILQAADENPREVEQIKAIHFLADRMQDQVQGVIVYFCQNEVGLFRLS